LVQNRVYFVAIVDLNTYFSLNVLKIKVVDNFLGPYNKEKRLFAEINPLFFPTNEPLACQK
jgi:hypothetical protein